MRRIVYALLALALTAMPAAAQNSSFTSFVKNAPEATTPFGPSDVIPVIQGNATNRYPVSEITPGMFRDGANATLPNALNNLGLGTSNFPAFSGLALAGATAVDGKLVVGAGTSQSQFPPETDYLGQFVEIARGTNAAPITTAGPTVKLSSTHAIQWSGVCANSVANECNATLSVEAVGLAGGMMQTSAGIFNARSSQTNATGHDAVGLTAIGRITDSGTGIGTGAYIEGRRDTDTAYALGAEIRTSNQTLTPCTVVYNTLSQCDGLWITAGGTSTTSSAVHIGNIFAGPALWKEGVTINQNGATDFGFNDQSSSTVSVNVAGTHTTAFDASGATLTNLLKGPGGLVITGGAAITAKNVFAQEASATQVTASSTGANRGAVLVNAEAGQQAVSIFSEAFTAKWFAGKNTDNSFFVFDNVNAKNAYSVSPTGVTALGETGSIGNTLVGDWGMAGTFTGTSLVSTAASTTQITANSTGANRAAILVNNTTAAQQAVAIFADASTPKWLVGKNTDNSYFLFDNANGVNAHSVTAAGVSAVGETGSTGNTLVGNWGVSGDLTATTASATQIVANSTGANRAGVLINNTTAAQQAVLVLSDASSGKWLVGKNTDNSFFVFDSTAAINAYSITTAGVSHVGEAASVGNTLVGGWAVTGTFGVAQASPAATDACTAGQIVADTGFLYTCASSGVWKRVAVTGGY